MTDSNEGKKRRVVRLPNGKPELFMPDWLVKGTHNRIHITEPEKPKPDAPKDDKQ